MRMSTLASGSALMFVAMMVPMIGPSVLHVSAQSFARRRWRSVALFVAAYGAVWIGAGIALLLLSAEVATSPTAIAAVVAMVAAWQCSPLKQRCLNRCHNHSALAAFGAEADRDAIHFGLTHGLWCVGSCSALMLVPMLFPSAHLASMAAMTLWIAGEQLDRPTPPQWRLRWPRKSFRIAVGQVWTRLPFEPARRQLAS